MNLKLENEIQYGARSRGKIQSLSQLNVKFSKNESQFYKELQRNNESFNTYSVLK